eukprot:TRINITY_DN407_c0_g2_i3.p1 TRINITY_DN407_c0_g2~~TRINITY_DN407_c0_g2_i3.p1  ORF type:complete len:111 (-),score=34.17 TRINITY_DN407_c0_g2_i3:140-472(-)
MITVIHTAMQHNRTVRDLLNADPRATVSWQEVTVSNQGTETTLRPINWIVKEEKRTKRGTFFARVFLSGEWVLRRYNVKGMVLVRSDMENDEEEDDEEEEEEEEGTVKRY